MWPAIFLLVWISWRVEANAWLFPPNSTQSISAAEIPTWRLGEVYELIWESSLPEYYVFIQQVSKSMADGRADIFHKNSGMNSFSRMNWTVQLFRFDLSIPNTLFHFGIVGSGSGEFLSQPIKIAPSLSSSPSTVNSNSSSTVTVIATPVAAVRKGNTSIALGLGLGLGITLLLAMLVICLLLHKTRTATNQCSDIVESPTNGCFLEEQREIHMLETPPQELEARDLSHEAP